MCASGSLRAICFLHLVILLFLLWHGVGSLLVGLFLRRGGRRLAHGGVFFRTNGWNDLWFRFCLFLRLWVLRLGRGGLGLLRRLVVVGTDLDSLGWRSIKASHFNCENALIQGGADAAGVHSVDCDLQSSDAGDRRIRGYGRGMDRWNARGTSQWHWDRRTVYVHPSRSGICYRRWCPAYWQARLEDR